jgi:hypothetical protein
VLVLGEKDCPKAADLLPQMKLNEMHHRLHAVQQPGWVQELMKQAINESMRDLLDDED